MDLQVLPELSLCTVPWNKNVHMAHTAYKSSHLSFKDKKADDFLLCKSQRIFRQTKRARKSLGAVMRPLLSFRPIADGDNIKQHMAINKKSKFCVVCLPSTPIGHKPKP